MQEIHFELTPGLQRELEHLEGEEPVPYSSHEEFLERTENTLYRGSVLELHSRLSLKSRVLDVGCGNGETSLLLASLGHEVYSIEPSLNRCRALSLSAQQMGLPIHTYRCTGEALDQIALPPLDGCLFHSSLHHCDDPLKTLRHVKNVLRQGGTLVLNEPILRFYRSKAWFQKQLVENPVKMGHYGGNEHIYYFKEYVKFLQAAGFSKIEFCWSNRGIEPRQTFMRDLESRIEGQYQHTVLRCFVKYGIHRAIKTLSKWPLTNTLLITPLLCISLFQASFIAIKEEGAV